MSVFLKGLVAAGLVFSMAAGTTNCAGELDGFCPSEGDDVVELQVASHADQTNNVVQSEVRDTHGHASAQRLNTQENLLVNGNVIRLRSEGNTYLGVCGGTTINCDGDTYEVYAFDDYGAEQTNFVVEQTGASIALKHVSTGAYIGMCGNARTDHGEPGCENSIHGVSAYSEKKDRTILTVEMVGTDYYLKSPSHGSYLGTCGYQIKTCGNSKFGVYAYPSKLERTAWKVELVITKEGDCEDAWGYCDKEKTSMCNLGQYAKQCRATCGQC